jgi:hypothetical protein
MDSKFPDLSQQLRLLGISPKVPPANLGTELRLLIGNKGSGQIPATTASMQPSEMAQRLAGNRLRQRARTNGLAFKHSDLARRRKLPPKVREEALDALLRLGQQQDSIGEIVSGAAIGRQILDHLGERSDAISMRLRLEATQLILDGGEENRDGAAERIRRRQRIMTRDLYRFGDRFKAAQSSSNEGLLARMHALTVHDTDRWRQIHLKQAVQHTKDARDMLISIKRGIYQPAQMIFMRGQVCYLQNRFLIELEELGDAWEGICELIDLAESLNDARLWTDALRCIALYHLTRHNIHEAAESLSYLCYYFDRLTNPSVYTFMVIIFRLAEYATLIRRPVDQLAQIFFECWQRFPLVYFRIHAEHLFPQAKYNWPATASPERFASRCSNFQRV